MPLEIEERVAAAAGRTRATGRRPPALEQLLIDGCVRLHEIEMRLLHLSRRVGELLRRHEGAAHVKPLLDERRDLELRLARLRTDLRELQSFRRPLRLA